MVRSFCVLGSCCIVYFISGLIIIKNWSYFQESKKNYRQFSSVGFAALKPSVHEGVNYKKWCTKTAMNCFHAFRGKPDGTLTSQQEEAFEVVNNLFRGNVPSVLGDKYSQSLHDYI